MAGQTRGNLIPSGPTRWKALRVLRLLSRLEIIFPPLISTQLDRFLVAPRLTRFGILSVPLTVLMITLIIFAVKPLVPLIGHGLSVSIPSPFILKFPVTVMSRIFSLFLPWFIVVFLTRTINRWFSILLICFIRPSIILRLILIQILLVSKCFMVLTVPSISRVTVRRLLQWTVFLRLERLIILSLIWVIFPFRWLFVVPLCRPLCL